MTDDTSTEVDVKGPGQGARIGKLSRADQRQLKIELAEALVKRAALARKYGVSGPYVTQFAKQYKREIESIRDDIDKEKARELAGLWIADQGQRIAAYQADHELSASSDYSGHYEQIRTRTQILKNVAEELGQIQGRQPTVGVVVQHVLVGVDPEVLT